MDRRTFLSGMAIGVLTTPLAAQAPPTGRTPRIGIISMRRPGIPNPFTKALMQGLRERGYVEGSNLVIEYPDALGREDRLPELAAELVRKRVDVILIIGPGPLRYWEAPLADAGCILGLKVQAPVRVRDAPKFQFAINLKAAKVLGLTIPQSVLLRADEVIQ